MFHHGISLERLAPLNLIIAICVLAAPTLADERTPSWSAKRVTTEEGDEIPKVAQSSRGLPANYASPSELESYADPSDESFGSDQESILLSDQTPNYFGLSWHPSRVYGPLN